MATLFGQQARFPLRMTPEGVKPGSTGTIFDVEQLPTLAGPGPKVRVQIDDYKSDWIFPAQLEILNTTATKAGWYIERWVAGGTLGAALAEKESNPTPCGARPFPHEAGYRLTAAMAGNRGRQLSSELQSMMRPPSIS
jgi:hypothetical protein